MRLAAAVSAVALGAVASAGLAAWRADATAVRPGGSLPVELAGERLVAPAFAIPAARPLEPRRGATVWAPVLRPTLARAGPGVRFPRLALVRPRTPESTTNLVVALRRHQGARRLWVQVRLAVLPNGATGWIRRDALGGYVVVRTHLVIDLHRLTATLMRGHRVVLRASIGVGQPRWPTPRGHFYVRDRLTEFGNPFYGPIAFGTSARSPVLTDWPKGGYIGIHGTNQPRLIPGRISHGCIRLRNHDIRRLARLMPIGTPITIT
jgi:lipoprotein-anchoring transpeptidase ErfK/SrfK